MLDVRLPDFNFAISLYVWFRDLDAMGHVNNAVYFQFFEQARTRYWLSLLSGESPSAGLSHPPSQHVDEHAFQKINFIVAHAECDYVTPARMGESLLVGCRISEIGRSSFTFEYRIVTGEKTTSEAESRVVASGKTVQVLYDWTDRKPIPFSDELRKKIELREGRVVKSRSRRTTSDH